MSMINNNTGNALKVLLAMATGGAMVGYQVSGSGAVAQTVATKLAETVSVTDFGATGDGVTDDTTAIAAAHATGKTVTYLAGDYVITDEIALESDAAVILDPAAIITQSTANKSVFRALTKANILVFANGAQFVGEGAWSSGWTGNSGHEDRVIAFVDCTTCGVYNPYIKNGANAGLYIEGCEGFRSTGARIEGTHIHGVALAAGNNFQNGIYIKHSDTYGDCIDIEVTGFDVSNSAQGVLVEDATAVAEGSNITLKGVVHDIIGQHGFYIQTGDITVDAQVRNVASDAVKVQTAATNLDIRNINIKVNGQDIGLSVFELQCTGTGSISNIIADVTGSNAVRGISINNGISRAKIRSSFDTISAQALIVQGTRLDDIEIDIAAEDIGQNGITITSSDCVGLKIWPTIRQANTTGSTVPPYYGIFVEGGAGCDVEFIDPVATDAGANQKYGFYNVDSPVKVTGSAEFTGGSSKSARSDIALLSWPEKVILDGDTHNNILSPQYFSASKGTIKSNAQSTSTAYVYPWTKTIPDESAFLFNISLSAKLADSSERMGIVIAALVYRDAGGSVVIQGQSTPVPEIKSVTFGGVYSLEASGTNIRIKAHSGAAATVYDWEARVTYEEIS